jgi:uncharacterized UBP type Zn finger protein
MGIWSNLRFFIQRGRSSSRPCSHREMIRDVTRGSTGCEECMALGDTWVHLRMCMTCGQVGCCDSSKNKHAHRHADAMGHPIARSLEPGENWLWCYVDERIVSLPS